MQHKNATNSTVTDDQILYISDKGKISGCLSLILVLFICITCMSQTYYVDTSSTGTGDGTTPEITGPHAAWKNFYQITGLLPGDSVLFHRGDTWTNCLTITKSGEPNNYITFEAYGTGEDPLIDVSNTSAAVPAIWVLGVDYVEIKNFRLKGSGGLAAMNVRQYGTKSGSGALGSGYTVTVRDVNVLSNYGASEGNHDGFSLQAWPASSSQALFYNITATKCRHATEFGGSHQCLTLHQNCKAKVYTANFSDSVNWYVGTEGSQVEFYNLTANTSTSYGITTTGGATSENLCLITDSNLTADGGGGGKLFSVSSNASREGSRIIVQDSYLKSSQSSTGINNGNITLLHNTIDINDPGWRFEHYNGLLLLQDNTFICGDTADYASIFHITSPARIIASGNVFKIGTMEYSVFCFLKSTTPPAAASEIKNNIFKNVSGGSSAIIIDDDAYAPDIQNNVFYNVSRSGKAIDLDHDGDEDINKRPNLRHNIFYKIAKVIETSPGIPYTSSYNCYYDSENLNDKGSIASDPLFVDAQADDFHLKSQGWRWDQQQQLWCWDDVTSRCIDAGNPGTPLGDELLNVPPDPSNERGVNLRIDMGAYGGTEQAGISPHNWNLLADWNNDGTVNLTDLSSYATNWLADANKLSEDVDRNGTVNFLDFVLLAQDWLKETTWLP